MIEVDPHCCVMTMDDVDIRISGSPHGYLVLLCMTSCTVRSIASDCCALPTIAETDVILTQTMSCAMSAQRDFQVSNDLMSL